MKSQERKQYFPTLFSVIKLNKYGDKMWISVYQNQLTTEHDDGCSGVSNAS